MPFNGLPFDDKKELLNHLTGDMGLDSDKAEEVAEIVVDEAKSDEGDPKALLQSIKDGAKSILSGIGLETVSWVENPSQDSMFVMMKDGDNRVKKSTNIYKEPEEDEWKTVYGPVMRPNDIDKDGDIAPAHDIRKAAHEFMAEGRVKQFDQDHDLNTGKGTLVESWILKEDKEYELPDGSKEVIEEGSWMVGVQPNKEVKERIENGEITGWSIFGQADKVELKNKPEWKNFNNESVNNTSKEDTMSENQDTSNDEELSLKDVHSELKEFKEAFNEFKEAPEPSTVKNVEELKELKSEEENPVIQLGKDFELETAEKDNELKADNMSDLMDMLEDELSEENFSMLVDAVRGDGEMEEVEEEMDEDEEDEEKQEQEKTAKHKAKQVDTQVEKGSRTGVSFKDRIAG